MDLILYKIVKLSYIPYFSGVGIKTLNGSVASDVVQNARAVSMSGN